MKLIVLFLQYDAEKYPNAFTYLKKYLKFITIDTEIIIIDNKVESKLHRILYKDGTIGIGGDNTLWEFSGWQRGIDYLHENDIDYDAILFVNDAFLAPGHNELIDIISDESVLKCIKEDSMIGSLCDSYYGKCEISGYESYDFIRSNCFILSKSLMHKLVTLWSVDKSFLERCITKEPSYPYFKTDAPLNDYMKIGVIDCLTKYWHTKFKLTDNWELFRMKTLALFNEHLLTQRVRAIKW